jgi:hypothetical protein
MHQIRKTHVAIKGGPGGVGVFYDKDDKQVHLHDGTTDRIVTERVAGLTAKTADYTVVFPADNGKIFEAEAASSLVFTLPAVSSANKGMRVTVVVAQLPGSGSGTTISPNASDRIAYKADDADLVNTAATDALGDLVTLESDGVDGWIVVTKIGTWA